MLAEYRHEIDKYFSDKHIKAKCHHYDSPFRSRKQSSDDGDDSDSDEDHDNNDADDLTS